MIEHGEKIIEFLNVTFSFPGGKVILQDFSIKLAANEFYLIRGPSGSGKSTLLRLINRLEEPIEGEIQYKGCPLSDYSPPLLRRSILYIQQTPIAVDGSVRDNLLLPFTFNNNYLPSPPDDQMLRENLKQFLLDDVRLEDTALTLSAGQLQRLCFIRGLLMSPEILLLDEPANALDHESARIVQHTAEKLCQNSKMTVFYVSHHQFNPEFVEPVILELPGGLSGK